MPVPSLDEIDGRSGHRWVTAIRARLEAEFQPRMTFLPPSSCLWRRDPIISALTSAINKLNQAQLATADCACCYCASGRPFADFAVAPPSSKSDGLGRGNLPLPRPFSPLAKKPSRAARAKKAGAA